MNSLMGKQLLLTRLWVARQDIVAVPQLLDTDLPRLQKRVAALAAHGRSVELPSQVSPT